jgi:3-phenylpropionate/trans-cinnamate dioxygenase ferredoxin component
MGDGVNGPDDAAHWVAVAASAELAPGAAVTAPAGEAEVAVFNVDGELLAVEARCLHKGGALADGLVSGGVVTCPLHWWRYDLRTGERLGAPDLRLACYPVRVLDGRVEVCVPSPRRPAPSLRARLLAAGRDWQEHRLDTSSPGLGRNCPNDS